MTVDVVKLALGLRQAAEHAGEGVTVIQVRCHDCDPRAELVILQEDILCAQLDCNRDDAFEALACAHEMFRVRGHRLRVEILARK